MADLADLTTQVNVLYLGTLPRMDTSADFAGNYTAENASTVISPPVTFTKESGMQLRTFNMTDSVPDRILAGDDNATYKNDFVSVDGGANQQVDSVIRVNITFSYRATPGGPIQTATGVMMAVQLDDGGLYLWPNDEYNSSYTLLDNRGTITSLTINSVTSINHSADGLFYKDGSIVGSVACFTRGTLIETEHGPMAIEDVFPGTLCFTRDAGLQPLRWRGSARVGGGHHGIPENMKPIRIAAGALGNGLPNTDLLVSPQHRMLVSSRIAERMFGAREVLIAAKHLTGLQGVEVAEDMHEVEYWHLLFDDHQIVIANGAASESLYTGPMALSSVSEASRQEILALFPQLAEMTYDALPSHARLAIPGRRARRFVERVANNAPAAGAVLQ